MRRPERRGENWKIERWGSDGARADEEELANPEGALESVSACSRRGRSWPSSTQSGGGAFGDSQSRRNADQLQAYMTYLGRPVDTLPGVVELRRWVELASKLQMQQPSREPSVALSSPKSVPRPLLP